MGRSIRCYSRIIEDTPHTETVVAEHLVHGHWCARCKKIVTPKLTDALPGATLGLHLVVFSAWVHYGVGVSLGNLVKLAAHLWGLSVSCGRLTQAWKNLAGLLEGEYSAIGERLRTSAVLHAEETGWRVNGVTFWRWAFVNRKDCYYPIDRRRGSSVVEKLLGVLFPSILIIVHVGMSLQRPLPAVEHTEKPGLITTHPAGFVRRVSLAWEEASSRAA